MDTKKAIEIVKAMSKEAIENATFVEHKPTPKHVVWKDNSIVSQRSKHVMVSRNDSFRKYLNKNLIGG